MKVLFICSGREDYQSDMLFHGLKSIADIEVHESSDMWYMYAGMSQEKKAALYGKGFSLYGLIDQSLKNYEHENIIREKISSKWYDLIIYGQIKKDDSFIDIVKKVYSKDEIIIVDGQDHQYLIKKYFGIGHYFKRELTDTNAKRGVLPINFAIPESKVLHTKVAKQKDWATIIPGDRSTYIYNNELDYYRDYQISKYGLTTKKAGWDCLRHYEILANGCIPVFTDIQECPRFSLTKLPKDTIYRSNGLVKWNQMNERLLEEFNEFYLDWTSRYLTTRALANYVLSFI